MRVEPAGPIGQVGPGRAAVPLDLRAAEFLPEAWSILAGIEEALSGLSSPETAAAERLLLVLTHRLAGSAALFGLDAVAQVADRMENAAERLAGGGDQAQALDVLHHGLARLVRLLEGGAAPPAPAPGPPPEDPLLVELRGIAHREPEVMEDFLTEMREHLGEAEDVLARIAEAGLPPAPELVATLFRRMHTLKGAAFVVGCQPVGALAHRIEDALVVLRAHPERLAPEGLRTALATLDLLHRMADVLATPAGPAPDPPLGSLHRQGLEQLDAWLTALAAAAEPPEGAASAPDGPAAGRATPRTGAPGLRIPLATVDGLVQVTGELLALRNRLRSEIERLERLREERQDTVERLRRTLREFSGRHFDPPTPAAPAPDAGTAAGFSELELDRYDDFNVLARRLDEITADLSEEEIQEADLDRQLAAGADDLRRLVDELHAGVGRLRLVPIGQVFGRCARLVRRAASAAGREVVLEVAGDRVEVDAAIAEQIWEPLLHLVQNAVDHGFEPAEQRRALGKPAAGRLRLRAAAEGRRVVVEVEDDGAGIDAARVRSRAWELGLRPAEELARLDEPGALELIFLPGLSTRTAATASAGRGVGLDVVRTTLERLGGSVEVRTAAGSGTCFRLAFPLTLVVAEALLVRAGGEILALPATAVERIVEAGRSAGTVGPLEPGGPPVAAVDLARVLGLPPGGEDRGPAAVIGSPGRRRALRVDEVLGSETAVLRPLGPFFVHFDLYSGGLLTREGRFVLLLNPQAAFAAAGAAESPAPVPAPLSRPLRVLLADDSVSVRKVLGGMLARAGYEVALAVDGEEAMALLEAGPCDLLITDLEMPRRNGYELLAWLRRRPATARLPALVVTTRIGEKHRELALQVGAVSCLSKPVEEEVLLRTVADLVVRGGRKIS